MKKWEWAFFWKMNAMGSMAVFNANKVENEKQIVKMK